MTRIQVVLAIATASISLMAWGCGGSQEGSAFTPSEGDDVTSSGSGSGSASLPNDPQAEAAAKYCAHAIEKAETQPPDALDRKKIQACLTAIRPQMKAKCSKGVDREVILKIIVDKSGAVSDAFAIGDGADSPEAACVSEMVKAVQFPKFKASAQQVIKKYPFNI